MGVIGALILLIFLSWVAAQVLRTARRRSVRPVRRKDALRIATRDQRNYIWWKYKGRCAHCHKQCFRSRNWHPDRGEIDHIKPWSWGGRTTILNLQLLCGECNRRKGSRYIG